MCNVKWERGGKDIKGVVTCIFTSIRDLMRYLYKKRLFSSHMQGKENFNGFCGKL